MIYVKNLELKNNLYERVKTCLSVEDLEKLNVDKISGLSQDSYKEIGSVFFDDGIEAKVALVSGITTYWIEIQLYKDEKAMSEIYQFYNLDEVMEVTENSVTYSAIISSESDIFDVATYCWSALSDGDFSEEWEDNCQDGEMVFIVPKGWLVSKILTNPALRTGRLFVEDLSGKSINEIVQMWNNLYTYEEGLRVHLEARADNVVKAIKSNDCVYCNKR